MTNRHRDALILHSAGRTQQSFSEGARCHADGQVQRLAARKLHLR